MYKVVCVFQIVTNLVFALLAVYMLMQFHAAMLSLPVIIVYLMLFSGW